MTFTFKNIFNQRVAAILLWSCLAVSLSAPVAAEPGKYDVHLSWFVDMQQYESSAHGNLFCVQCHSAVAESSAHPDPTDITREAADFFNKESCGGSDCHETTMLDIEKGVHGRIRFQNQEKYANCIECHDPHTVTSSKADTRVSEGEGRDLCQPVVKNQILPAECGKDDGCLECHSASAGEGTTEPSREAALCFSCHDQAGKYAGQEAYKHIPVIDTAAYQTTEHAGNSCTDCHISSATYGHINTVQSCESCHTPHHEGEIHDAHSSVDCRSCHLQGDITVDQEAGRISWQRNPTDGGTTNIHRLVDTDQEINCIRCHTKGNDVGASEMVLPAKSVICMTCHTATFTVSDPITLVTLIISLLIFAGLISLWLTAGTGPDSQESAISRIAKTFRAIVRVIFSRRMGPVFKAILLDGIIQRKLFFQSKTRWLSHGLIFYSFLLRFGFGMIVLLISLFFPQWEVTGTLLDKNHPLGAFLFDLTGVLIIVGAGLTVSRKIARRKHQWPGLPRQEWLSLSLMGGIILVGFVLEGVRIAMTIDSSGQQFAFLGYAISLIFINLNGSAELYGYLWYLHAILTAAFII
jgi:predicted CXXCH cytochrome family protein